MRLTLAAACCLSTAALAQVYPIPALPGNPSMTPSAATGVSADGNTVFAAESTTSVTPRLATRWTLAEGSTPLGPGVAWAGTPDGSTIVGFGTQEAWRWTAATGTVSIPGMNQAVCISRDGIWIGGGSPSAPAIWSASTGMLPILADGPVQGISADGSVTVGGWNRAFRAVNRIPVSLPEGSYGRAISTDGTICAGHITVDFVTYPCTFNADGYTILPAPSGTVRVRGMSADGAIVLGAIGTTACLWINGVHHQFNAYLTNAIGFADPGWSFTLVRGVSDDGLVFVGEGRHLEAGVWRDRGWVANLRAGPPCSATFYDHPASRRLSEGDDLVLTSHYFSRYPQSPRWHKDGLPLQDDGRIMGSGTAALEVHDLRPGDAGAYALIIPATCGAIPSNTASISIAPPSTIRYVVPGAAISGDGLSWATAFSTLQPALSASLPGDEIWVGEGRLVPSGGSAASFVLPSGVTVRGGFRGTESSPADRDPALIHATVLSGDQPSADSARVVLVRGTTMLDRVTIADANGTQGPGVTAGGGCTVDGGALLAVDCVIQNNRAFNPQFGGAGIGLLANSSAALLRTTLNNNSIRIAGYSGLEGSGIYATRSSLVLVESNISNSRGINDAGGCTAGTGVTRPGGLGGAIYGDRSLVALRGCTFFKNSGGPGSDATMCGPIYTGNAPGGLGGAIYLTDSAAELTRCRFVSNFTGNGGTIENGSGGPFRGSPGGDGGAVFIAATPTSRTIIESCTFVGNRSGNGSPGGSGDYGETGGWGGAGGVGGAVMITGATSPVCILNCTFVGNAAGRGGTASGVAPPGVHGSSAAIFTSSLPVTISNCVFVNNLSGDGSLEGSIDRPELVRSSLVQSNASPANHTFIAPAFFANPLGPDGIPASGDENFAPRADSPLIDAGDNTLVTSLFDLSGNPRFIDDPNTPDTGIGVAPIIDLGAFEFQPGTNCPADITADGSIDGDDAIAFFNLWDSGHPAGDIDQDNDTDSDDILYFFARFEGGC